VIAAIRSVAPNSSVEALVSDMNGEEESLNVILAARPDVLGHNLETVPRLTPLVRPAASYRRSLALLEAAARSRCSGLNERTARRPLVKSGLMLGLGEQTAEVQDVLTDCVAAGVDVVTIGQYLQPHPECLPVSRFVPPEEFVALETWAASRGLVVRAGPLVRSSYRAADLLDCFPTAGPRRV
jgi:lipoic acid synthetase